ncbi:MAG: hypothetical protein FWE68_04765, partial [Defluviitaleaceae bacterium]|nr:hypothetical protein [Defluviitaleaceae bacterium]
RQEVYTVDVFKSAVFRRFLAYISAGLAMLAAAAAFAVDAFGRALRIYDARDMLTGVHTDAFAVQLAETARWVSLSNWLFLGFLACFMIFMWALETKT